MRTGLDTDCMESHRSDQAHSARPKLACMAPQKESSYGCVLRGPLHRSRHLAKLEAPALARISGHFTSGRRAEWRSMGCAADSGLNRFGLIVYDFHHERHVPEGVKLPASAAVYWQTISRSSNREQDRLQRVPFWQYSSNSHGTVIAQCV